MHKYFIGKFHKKYQTERWKKHHLQATRYYIYRTFCDSHTILLSFVQNERKKIWKMRKIRYCEIIYL